ncbi:MAG: hypothetical protein EKK53_17040 [Burkholderiales bacterium]|nr:MAG: hypothetical protein EKK53_17040 [Burkholderiales bacterium]
MSIYTEEARRLALCLIKDRPMGMTLAEAGRVILDGLSEAGERAEATLTITAPNGDTIKCHGTKLDMLTLDRIVKAKAGA